MGSKKRSLQVGVFSIRSVIHIVTDNHLAMVSEIHVSTFPFAVVHGYARITDCGIA